MQQVFQLGMVSVFWLEELYVKPEHKGLGIGRALFNAVAKYGADTSCNRLEWFCPDWETSPISFYKKLGATDMTETEGYHALKLNRQQLTLLGNTSNHH